MKKQLRELFHVVIIVGSFSLLHQFFRVCFGVDGLQELMERMFNYILGPLQNGLGAGLIVILLTHGLWFFGIHGHNMLDTVIKQHFADATAGIFSKTMQDVFVLLGGTGAMLCLVVALLLFAKKKGDSVILRGWRHRQLHLILVNRVVWYSDHIKSTFCCAVYACSTC